MKRFVIAFVLAMSWMFWPNVSRAEDAPSHVSQLYSAMSWCLPSDRVADPVRVRESDVESMFVQVGQQQFGLLWMQPGTYLEFVNIHHPNEPRARVIFPMPADGDSQQSVEEQKMFALMTAGCFALSDAPKR